jgi:hypothetical protein
VLILREIYRKIFHNHIPIPTIDFSLVNISQKTTSFVRTHSDNNGFLIRQKRGPFNHSPFGKIHGSTTTLSNGSPAVFYANWQNITQDPFILNAVQGFKICFRSHPVQSTVSRVSNQDLIIKDEISSLLKKGAIEHVPFSTDGFYHRLFLVPQKGGGQRPVLDLSSLNQFIDTEHFNMENLATLKSLLNKGGYMINFPIHPVSQKFLRFLFGNETSG